MTNTNEFTDLGREMQVFGGVLRCMVCGIEEPLRDIGTKLANGWPSHCDYTMRWITARQILEGESES